MARRKKRWSQLSAWTVVMLGLAAGVTMNLVTAWVQKDILSNAFYFLLVIFLLAALTYSGIKMRTPDFLKNIFILIVATVSLNLFSTWIQYSVLKDTYSLPIVTLLLSISVIALAISGLIQSNYYGKLKRRAIRTYKSSAKSMTPVLLQQEEKIEKPIPRKNKKKK